MPEQRNPIDRKLRAAWRREQGFFHCRGASHAALWIVAVIVFCLAVDWLLDLPGLFRVLLGVFRLGLVARGLWRRWFVRLRAYDANRVALQVEAVHPELRSLLISHVQLRGAPRSDAASPRLVEAVSEQAIEVTKPLSFSGIVDFRRLRKIAAAAAATLLLFGASVLYATDVYRVFFARLLDPSSTAGYPTRTRVVEMTGDLQVRHGDPVEIRARIEGEPVDQGILRLRFRDASGEFATGWEEVPLAPASDGSTEFFWRQERAVRSFSFYAELGDGSSGTHGVTVVPPPVVLERKVRLVFPAYTGESPKELDSMSFEALTGTVVEWRLRCDRALSAAELIPEVGEPASFDVDASDPRRVRLERRLTEPLTYRLRWTQREHGFRFEEAVAHSIRVRSDRPPRVELLSPKTDEKATRQKELQIAFQSSDDFSPEEAWIVYSVVDGVEKRVAIGSARPDGPVRWKPLESIPELAEGDILTWAVEVSDNRTGPEGPNLGRSRSLEIEIVSVEEYLRYLDELRAELYGDIKRVLEDETRSSRNVLDLGEETK